MLKHQEPTLGSWGRYVSEKIYEKLRSHGHPDTLVKIQATPRVKTVESARGKLARKNYSDPVRQMTDLVGVRFVVLLSSDINTISNIIETTSEWSAVISRDFLEERNLKTNVFDYQSKHYEVRPTPELTEQLGMEQPFCCEIQIRTLLQHAYAEMVHDNIYKPNGEVPALAKRHVARSMALIETTDEIFISTMELLSQSNAPRDEFQDKLHDIYKAMIDISPGADLKTENAFLENFPELVTVDSIKEISTLLTKKPFIIQKIKNRTAQPLLFNYSIILFVYLIVTKYSKDEVHDRWPLPGDWRSLTLVEADMNS
ncbi:GTP pyrophosphokinase family protein [Pseudomonas putida]